MALGIPDDPNQQKRLLIGLLPLLALFGYWYFLHGNYVTELTAMETRLENIETRNTQARLRAPQSRQLEERLAGFERHIERLEQLVPRNEEVSQLLNTISERADQIGVNIVRFAPGQTNVGAHYNRRTFELIVNGTYHDLGRFLSDIGSLPRIITPTDLHLASGAAGEQDLEAAFLIETYVLPEPGQSGPNQGGTGA